MTATPAQQQDSRPVLFEELATATPYQLGVATLQAEKSLNALTLTMVQQLYQQLQAWEHDEHIAAIILKGTGDKAFCAGGDVRALYHAIKQNPHHPNPLAVQFFTQEYQLNHLIHTSKKPIIVWGHGIVMGGGLGLLAGASHRVVTPTTRIAMPEITIGLYPDVAGSWFLQRLPAWLGLFISLTAAPLNAHDALLCNLADYALPADSYASLLQQLQGTDWCLRPADNQTIASRVLSRFSQSHPVTLPDSLVAKHALPLQRLAHSGDLADIAAAIAALDSNDPWLEQAKHTFAQGSPTSIAIIWEIFRRSKHLSLAAALQQELVLSINFCHKPDFPEGVRALLVDKDKSPNWQYKTLQDIPHDWILSHFISPWIPQNHPLAGLASTSSH